MLHLEGSECINNSEGIVSRENVDIRDIYRHMRDKLSDNKCITKRFISWRTSSCSGQSIDMYNYVLG